ncbi:hypothetical protein CJ030_MR5G010207 [Morella rubra]|uniref:Putative plant transposon protein domain-containing protein n=1 Tax=Morella rubra TaxID=262757 RepID=A0A6A1VLV6_9ROSI|nr:hypothetical protein CJ030_MR5G010207 [Morella rubra]
MGNEVFPKYVTLFFSNMTVGWEAGGLFTVKSMVGGRDIILNEVILGDILGIPHVGIRAYEFKTWPVCKGFDYGEALVYLLGNGVAEDAPRKIHANQLPIHSRLLHLICTHNLIPRGGHREEVTFMDVFVIERLLKEKKFNLPYIMLKHMEAACESKKNLPYGLLFTQIFRYFGVALSSGERDTLTKCEQFDTAVLTGWVIEGLPEILGCRSVRLVMRMRMLMRLWLRLRMSLRVRRVSDPTFSFDARFTAFEDRMTAMHEAQKKFLQESVTSMQEEQRQFFAEMRTFMARFPPP